MFDDASAERFDSATASCGPTTSDSTNLRLRSMATGLDIEPPFDPHPLGVGLRPLLLPDGKTLLLSTAEGLILRFHIAR